VRGYAEKFLLIIKYKQMRTEILNKVGYHNLTKKRSNLSVELVYITPEVAKRYLMQNTQNRQKSGRNIKFLVDQMKKGLFLENGESIVFDKFQRITDGQHRLFSIVESGKSYYIPVVRGVESSTMATYDTGKNRSASDVLGLNGYKNTHLLSSFIKLIDKYSKKGHKTAVSSSTNRSETLTNQQVLNFCDVNYDWIYELIKKVSNIYCKSDGKVLSKTQFCFIAYLIGGENPSKEVFDFIKNISGLSREEETATSYLYGKLNNAKIIKEPLNFYWILGMSIKAWNYYIDGNPSVRYFKFKTSQELPKININN
jgi:hypothetical protein